MEFGWDEAKSERNVRERGFAFDLAVRLFDGTTLERQDKRRDYGEVRVIATGEVEGAVLTCVYVDRERNGQPLRWIISLRPASRKERAQYADRNKAPG